MIWVKLGGRCKGIYQYGVEIGWLGKLSGKLWELPWELFGLLGQLPGQSGARAVVKRNTDFDKWARAVVKRNIDF